MPRKRSYSKSKKRNQRRSKYKRRISRKSNTRRMKGGRQQNYLFDNWPACFINNM